MAKLGRLNIADKTSLFERRLLEFHWTEIDTNLVLNGENSNSNYASPCPFPISGSSKIYDVVFVLFHIIQMKKIFEVSLLVMHLQEDATLVFVLHHPKSTFSVRVRTQRRDFVLESLKPESLKVHGRVV